MTHYSFKEFLTSKEGNSINEALGEYDNNLAKELLKDLDPLIKYFKIDVKKINMEDRAGNLPFLSIKTYNVITKGSWTAGTFFNMNDANECVKFFGDTEISTAINGAGTKYGATVNVDNMGTYLYWSDITALCDRFAIRVDLKGIEKKCSELAAKKPL
jgi:hypothetical protein